MPSRPVRARVPSEVRAPLDTGMGAASDDAGGDEPVANTRSAASAQARFVAAQTIAVARNPASGISTKAAPSEPSTAPSVLAAYNGAMAAPARICAPTPACDARTRSIAGSVAPMAAVAGSNHRKVPAKIHAQCATGAGDSGNHDTHVADSGASPNASTSAQPPITASQIAYARAGFAPRAMRAPIVNAPSDSPPKNAVTTASIDAASWPSA